MSKKADTPTPTTPTANPANPDTAINVAGVGAPPTGGGQTSYLGGFDPATYNPTHEAPIKFKPGHGQKTTGIFTPYNTKPSGIFYTEKDIWSPQADPASIPTLQKELVAMGYLSPTAYKPGVWDTTSANAYKSLLTFANASQMTLDDAKRILIENAQTTGKSKPGPYQTASPVDTRAAYETAAQKLLGHNLPTSEAEKFALQYQAQEQEAYKNLAAGISAGTLTTPAQPTAANAAEAAITQSHLADQTAYGTASRMLDFFSMLKGPV